MKKLFSLPAILLSIILIPGCNEKTDIKIGFSVGPSHERWEKDIDYFSSRVRNAGASIFVVEDEDSHETQVNQVRELLNNKIDILVIVPVDSRKASEIVKLSHQNDVRVIAYDRLINKL